MKVLKRALIIFLIFTFLCGVVYTGVVTGLARLIFPDKANGSIIEVDGVKYGSSLLAQQYTDDSHMWGRIMNLDVSTYKDENGKPLVYAGPSNLSPESDEYAQLVSNEGKQHCCDDSSDADRRFDRFNGRRLENNNDRCSSCNFGIGFQKERRCFCI